jgi:hypothetical protein
MKQQHHPIDLKTYQKGINSDSNKEVLGSSDSGEHIDALNMRSMPMDGDNFAKKKIKGEVSVYPNIDNRCIGGTGLPLSSDYECMMSQEINEHIIEIWASATPNINPPIFRVDGKIVASSFDIPIDLEHPLQYAKNESCVSGEFYVTNFNTPPMVFSLRDLMENSGMLPDSECTQKYFAEFNLSEYVIQSTGTLFKPMFIKQASGSPSSVYNFVFGSLGLAVGSYSYSYRYVTGQGDRTPFSPITELIPVVRNVSTQFAPYFPNSRTFGSAPDVNSPTNYGNHIRIKYDNTSNFSFIEIRRDSWYAGEPIDLPPVSEIIGSFPIEPGLNVVDVLDRVEPGSTTIEALTEDELIPTTSIKKAKAIRYYNDRLYLMNVSYQSQDIADEVDFVDEINPVFPTIQKLGKEGHRNVFNAAMYKNSIRGERIGVGVVFHDQNNGISYAVKVPNAESFTFPNRRDEVSTDALGTSYFGVVTAANVNGSISNTYEAFDHEDTVRRNEFDTTGGLELVNLFDNGILDSRYNTLNPTSQNDPDSDYEYQINGSVAIGDTPPFIPYNPKGFGLNYYSQGFAFKGISSFPSNFSEGFSVVQTSPARRVLAQGMGFYSMNQAEGILGSDGGKDTNAFWAYFPDLELYDPDTFIDLVNNPTSYQMQLVSPLGYFSEMYSGFNDDNPLAPRTKGVDMIVYPRVLKDGIHTDGDYMFNPALSGGGLSGITHTDGLDYVAYGRYMNYITQDTSSFPSNSNGNNIFQVLTVEEKVTYSGRQNFIRIELDQNFYNEAGPQYGSGNATLDADDEGPMQFREPMYVINLIKNDATPSQGLTTEFRYSANYIKFKSKVLQSDGSINQSCTLVSERWEDCIPRISGQINNAYSNLYRFIYVVDSQGIERRWLNVTFETPLFISALLNTIAINGFDVVTDASGSYNVYGVYTSQQSIQGSCPIFTLNFNEVSGFTNQTVVPDGSFVYVKYDNRIPVRCFIGDSYVNDSIWCPIDMEYGKNGEPRDDLAKFKWNVPFPFKGYGLAQGYKVLKNADILNVHNYIQDPLYFNLGGILSMWIRQLVVLWTAETRINLSFAFNNEAPDKANSDQYFPLVNYIPRAHKWNSGDEQDVDQFTQKNSLSDSYYDDYGFEWNLWNYGGFRFIPQTNIDYVKFQNTASYTSVPTLGFEEQSDYCTRVVWSEPRPINIQNTPTVKTFPPSNYYDVSDDTGEIKFAWSALSGDKGNNLYAFTNSGVCLLLVDKRIIHEINANELATVGSDIGGILNQLWIDRRVGMSDETWRTWAEYSNSLFFVNRQSSYMFVDNQIQDLASTGFLDLLRRIFLTKLGTGYSSKMSGGYNVLTSEYIMSVEDEEGFSTLIYGLNQQSLQCQSSYNYDKYLYVGNRLYGHKDFVTYELGIGNTIDGQEIECYLTNVSDKEIYYDKEFIRIRVNSNFKPDKIYFYDGYEDYKVDNFSSVVDATLNPIAIKDYFGYECYIPRKLASPHNRQQGRLAIFKIVSTDQEDFLITSTGVQYKALK